MRAPAIPFLAACAALAFLIVPAPAQQTDASVELLSGNSDCVTRSQVTNDGFVRQLIRCVNDGVRRFAIGQITVDENGVPDHFQEGQLEIQDTIEMYADLGWGIVTAQVVDLHAGVPYNASIPVYIFYRGDEDCATDDYYCTVPGDTPGTEAFLTLPWEVYGAWEHLVPLQPSWDCDYDGSIEPCWTYVDCNGVKHYAECVADVANAGFQPVYPPCATCEMTVNLENESWGRIKALYRGTRDR